jgi:nitrogen fixation NifU-like protein
VPEVVDPALGLYRAVVLDHYRRPRNRERIEAPDGSASVSNPVCGDQVTVELRRESGAIRAISARARGCSVAVAAASVMTELALGADAARVAALRRALERIVAGEAADAECDERLRAFAGVAPHPSRHRCALLAWEALEEALRGGAG